MIFKGKVYKDVWVDICGGNLWVTVDGFTSLYFQVKRHNVHFTFDIDMR